jgi:hypothetical protein
MTYVSRLYGLTVRSEVPLHQQRPVPGLAAIDLDIALGAPMAPVHEVPQGRLLLHLQSNKQYYDATEVDDAYLLRFYKTCDIRVDRELEHATVYPVDGADPSVVSVLVAGALFAFVLALRGMPVLHASAVQVGGGTLAFVGGSGMGKSTMATLLCASGALLITDDLLCLDLSRHPPTCELGATELRLRKAAGDLSARFSVAPSRRSTGDARDALATPVAVVEQLPLKAIVVPLPDRSSESTHATIERLHPMDAFLLLSRFPRLLGWHDEKIIRRQFQQLGEIADQVPVHLASLPWGPPFPDGLVEEVLRGVGLNIANPQ